MRRSLVAAIVAASILAGGAVGVIVGASSAPTIKACVTAGTKVLRYTTAGCATGEKLLTWNVTGPRGATGATGAQGPQGATGPQGPAGSGGGSSTLTFYDADAAGGLTGRGVTTTLKVPAGTYLLDWRVARLPGAGVLSSCWLTANPNLAVSPPDTLGALATFSSMTTILLVCDVTGPNAVNYQHAEIIATPATKLPSLP